MAVGEKLSDEDMDALMTVIDGNGDGIDQEEMQHSALNLAKVARTAEDGMLHEVRREMTSSLPLHCANFLAMQIHYMCSK